MSYENPFLTINQKLDLIDQKLNHLSKSSEIKKTSEEKKYLNSTEAADYLCISIRTLNRYASEGKIPYHKPSGYKFRLFKLAELQEWVEKGRKGTLQELFNSPADISFKMSTTHNRVLKKPASKEYLLYIQVTSGRRRPELWSYDNIPDRF
jgi:excisionase family DNA binding protein